MLYLGSKEPDHFLRFTAGDHIKFNMPMACSVTELAWGLLEFKDAYEDAGQLDYNGGLDHAYWGRP